MVPYLIPQVWANPEVPRLFSVMEFAPAPTLLSLIHASFRALTKMEPWMGEGRKGETAVFG